MYIYIYIYNFFFFCNCCDIFFLKLFYIKFQPMVSVSNDNSLSLDQDTN